MPSVSITTSQRQARSWWPEARLESLGALLGAGAILVVARLLTPDLSGSGTHQHLLLLPCIFKILTSLPCPFCGMTTSFALMAEGAIIPAFAAHVLGPLAYLATWGVVAAGGIGLVRNKSPLPRWLFSQRGGRVVLAVFLVGWVVNLARVLLDVGFTP